MSRYRKVHSCLWGDSKFQALSRPQPNGQSLWLYMLTGSATINIPGLLPIGLGGLADALKWPFAGTQKAWHEIEAQKMATADWGAPLIFIPNALRYNEPESPNVIVAWRENWKQLPECQLKITAYDHILSYIDGMSEPFRKAFLKACQKPSGKAIGKAIGKASGKPL